MPLGRRLMLSLFGCVAVVSSAFAIYQGMADVHSLKDELQRQAQVLAESVQRPVTLALEHGYPGDLQAVVDQFPSHQRMVGFAVYDPRGVEVAKTTSLASRLTVTPEIVQSALRDGIAQGTFVHLHDQPTHIYVLPLGSNGRRSGAVAVFHNTAYITRPVWRHAIISVAQTLLIVAVTLLIVQWSLGRPLHRMAQWLQALRTGDGSAAGEAPQEELFGPLTKEVKQLATSLHVARAAAQEEARLRDAALDHWTPERLRISMQSKLNGSRIFAVSNREPYEHTRQGGKITWSVPPSGLVTALEPVLRASNGTWVAQGSGEADRETADAQGSLGVPPDHPEYKLRRVFLSKEEQQGFYFGFANEGIWPLCHIAHTRPIFRSEDWQQYRAVNAKFAAVLADEMKEEKAPLVLVQDYHFALLPRMIKDLRPEARVAIFWHIPWPNPEAFGICPWQRELLDGMLGADLIGFHIQAHCNNFLESVDRSMESRVDWEHFAVNRRDHLTTVRPYPISVAFNGNGESQSDPSLAERTALYKELGGRPQFIGLGVDRIDYTKGIPERLRAVERLLELYPEYREKFTFIQIGAPSRTSIKRYQDLGAEVAEEAERINRRFRSGAWKPVVLLDRHHSHAEIQPFYREATVCLVTSLHDGMNLVAKEFIASRSDEQGVLILSRFTGASHELSDGLVVNPYDTDDLAEAIRTGLEMPAEEQRARMQRLRASVKEHNVYRWAGNLIGDLAALRVGSKAAGKHRGSRNAA